MRRRGVPGVDECDLLALIDDIYGAAVETAALQRGPGSFPHRPQSLVGRGKFHVVAMSDLNGLSGAAPRHHVIGPFCYLASPHD